MVFQPPDMAVAEVVGERKLVVMCCQSTSFTSLQAPAGAPSVRASLVPSEWFRCSEDPRSLASIRVNASKLGMITLLSL
jgi:hypothetical protein